MEDRTLFIIGAGASVKANFPLANNFRNLLRDYSSNTHIDEKIRTLFQEVVTELEQHQNSTIDDYARMIYLHRGSTPDKVQLASQKINKAKAATVALFRLIETTIPRSAIESYGRIFDRFIPVSSEKAEDFKSIPADFISFNYDRVFEIAFHRRFPRCNESLHAALNSGAFALGQDTMYFNHNYASLLKVHGSIGIITSSFSSFPTISSDDETIRKPSPIDSGNLVREFVKNGIERETKFLETTISFPFEVDLCREINNSSKNLLIHYHQAVSEQVQRIAERSTKMEIIGYSCPEQNFPTFQKILNYAKNLKQITIVDPSAEIVQSQLEKYSFSNEIKIKLEKRAF